MGHELSLSVLGIAINASNFPLFIMQIISIALLAASVFAWPTLPPVQNFFCTDPEGSATKCNFVSSAIDGTRQQIYVDGPLCGVAF